MFVVSRCGRNKPQGKVLKDDVSKKYCLIYKLIQFVYFQCFISPEVCFTENLKLDFVESKSSLG